MGGGDIAPPAPLSTLLNATLFSPNSGEDPRSDAHQSQIIGGDADVHHTQIIGGDTVKLLGEIYPPIPPRVSASLIGTVYRHPSHKPSSFIKKFSEILYTFNVENRAFFVLRILI